MAMILAERPNPRVLGCHVLGEKILIIPVFIAGQPGSKPTPAACRVVRMGLYVGHELDLNSERLVHDEASA